MDYRFLTKNGSWLWILFRGEIIERSATGEPVSLLGLHIDIDDAKKEELERLELEPQLWQKFKMEAVGTMAGGMAHNFNNSLAVVLGSLEMAQRKLDQPEIVDTFIASAKAAAIRAKDLVLQILNYSR